MSNNVPGGVLHVSPNFAGMDVPFFTEIQKAIDFAYDNGYEFIVVHAGYYYITAAIILKDYVHIHFEPGVNIDNTVNDEYFTDAANPGMFHVTGDPYLNWKITADNIYTLADSSEIDPTAEPLDNRTIVDPLVNTEYFNKSSRFMMVYLVMQFNASVDQTVVRCIAQGNVVMEDTHVAAFADRVCYSFMVAGNKSYQIQVTGTTPPTIYSIYEIGEFSTYRVPS